MGLKDLFKRGGGMKDPVRGTAQVVSASMMHGEEAPADAQAGMPNVISRSGRDPSRLSEEPVDEDLDRLERLARLREQGVLADDEFRSQKRRITDE